MLINLETLIGIGNWTWLLYLVTLCLLFSIFIQKKVVSSSFFTVLIVTAVTWCMNEHRDFMLPIMGDEQLVAEYRTLIRYAWYYGFTLFNLLIIGAIYKVHVTLKLSYSYTAYLMIYSHLLLSLLQIISCVEQQSFASNPEEITIIHMAYVWGIPLINIICSVMALVFAVVALYKEKTKKISRGVL